MPTAAEFRGAASHFQFAAEDCDRVSSAVASIDGAHGAVGGRLQETIDAAITASMMGAGNLAIRCNELADLCLERAIACDAYANELAAWEQRVHAWELRRDDWANRTDMRSGPRAVGPRPLKPAPPQPWIEVD